VPGPCCVQWLRRGGPRRRDKDASNRDAEEYYQGLMNKICSGQGTPKRPQRLMRDVAVRGLRRGLERVVAPDEAHFGYRIWDGKGSSV